MKFVSLVQYWWVKEGIGYFLFIRRDVWFFFRQKKKDYGMYVFYILMGVLLVGDFFLYLILNLMLKVKFKISFLNCL
jgi:hypothetical protein